MQIIRSLILFATWLCVIPLATSKKNIRKEDGSDVLFPLEQRKLQQEMPTSCAAIPSCAALNLIGECCPTIDGKYLDCCGRSSRTCQDNAGCAQLGLEGACCPAENGNYLDCCNIIPEDCASCSRYPKCASVGLTGQCCPTIHGVTLSCCCETTF